jgi:hypothetical protein
MAWPTASSKLGGLLDQQVDRMGSAEYLHELSCQQSEYVSEAWSLSEGRLFRGVGPLIDRSQEACNSAVRAMIPLRFPCKSAEASTFNPPAPAAFAASIARRKALF